MVTRNQYIESIHTGLFCVADAAGTILCQAGDPAEKIFFRSAAKPFQALPLLLSGAADQFSFTAPELAMVCASHVGEPLHCQTTEQLLCRLGLSLEQLVCAPADSSEKLSGCTGNHIGMLAVALHRGYPLDGYEQLAHPVQQDLLQTLAEFVQENARDIVTGVDGCGVPTYLVSLRQAAMAYARLMTAVRQDDSLGQACRSVVQAMTRYPEMGSGRDEFSAALMTCTQGRLIGKIGAEALYCVGVAGYNWGICVKIADGAERALPPVVLHLLRQLQILTEHELGRLKPWHRPVLHNHQAAPVGEIVPVFAMPPAGDATVALGDAMHPGS